MYPRMCCELKEILIKEFAVGERVRDSADSCSIKPLKRFYFPTHTKNTRARVIVISSLDLSSLISHQLGVRLDLTSVLYATYCSFLFCVFHAP